ncbi:hypothetical protein [Longimicrobium sp.]|uniref:hypothetical protein n=1 Tax=Longimicrobium sp. TaxID=2029185 RepID=UPI002BAF4F9B|nr:hypothetical protein [Longimicrobium sp.]HSU14241.1 hypothetical protein [Longimicrobium sp.]
MKISIDLPDDLLAAADAAASRLGMSRDELVAEAVAAFVAKHDASSVTERLDAVYATEPGRLDAPVRRAQIRTLAREPWDGDR